MQSKIWFIGDCYTASFACQPGDPYFKYKQAGDKVWTKHVSEHFKLASELVVKVHNGSNALIVNNFLSVLHRIKKGDIVVIGTTYPASTLVVNGNRVDSVNYLNEYQWSSKAYSVDPKILRKFLADTYEKNLNLWDRFYENQIKSIAYELSNRDISTVLWSYKQWDNFEKIYEHTDGEINDIHFSWNGHKKFAEYIINKITTKDFITQCLT